MASKPASLPTGRSCTNSSGSPETTLQHHVSGEVLSRVSAYDWLGSAGFVPLGYILAGPLAVTIGLEPALLAAAAWAALSCTAALATRAVRALTTPAPGGQATGADTHGNEPAT